MVALEDVTQQFNPQVFKLLSKLLGVIENMLYENNILYDVISPGTWRKACKVKGRKRVEQKENTRVWVKNKYDFDVTEDECDAIGIGYCMYKNLQKNGLTK